MNAVLNCLVDYKTKKLVFNSYETSVFEIVTQVRDYIINENCPELAVDISAFNMFDAMKICSLCSVYHFSRYINGNLNWIINNVETCKVLRTLRLKNTSFEIIEKQSENRLYQAVS